MMDSLPGTEGLSVASHADAALTSELYWNSELPKSRMPNAITNILHPHPAEWAEEKSSSVSINKGGVNNNTSTGKTKPKKKVDIGGKRIRVSRPAKPAKRTKVGVGKGVVSVSTGHNHKGRSVYVRVAPGEVPFQYKYAGTDDQLKDKQNVAIFFLEKEMHQGTQMNLQFTKSTSTATFLPRQVADSIPFSSKKLPEILNHFKVEPNSVEAEMMNKTVRECEEAGIVGEEKYCATSLESMLDFSISKLGKEVKAISTEVNETQLQKYSIVGATKMAADKAVVCHKQNYPYLVFYCHKTSNTKAYMVSLVGDDGTKGKAVAVCHKDTAAWNPKHLAFQVLKIKPGTVPICHFLPEGHVVWVLLGPRKKTHETNYSLV